MLKFLDELLKPVDNLISLGSEFIVDKDKLIEFQFKALELKYQAADMLMQTKTVPWVDATVKIMFALNTFWRPMIGALMTAFGAYAHIKQIDIEPALHAIFDGAFPAWGVSRHTEKAKKLDRYDPTKDEWSDF